MSLKNLFCERGNCFLLFFDLTNMYTLEKLETWIKHIKDIKNGDQNYSMMLVGTKCDLFQDQDIDYQRIESFTRKHYLNFIKTSARELINVDETFVSVIDEYNNRICPTPNDILQENIKKSKCQCM